MKNKDFNAKAQRRQAAMKYNLFTQFIASLRLCVFALKVIYENAA